MYAFIAGHYPKWIPQPSEGDAATFGRLLAHMAGGANLVWFPMLI